MTEYVSDFKYNDLNIKISFNVEESKKHIVDDLNVINNEGVDKIISEKFIPWLKGEQFKDSDDEKIKAGLSLYEVQYHYDKICKEYSPTGKEDYFGQFSFYFESGSEYTDDIFEVVEMEVYVYNNEIVKVIGYDI